MQQEVNPKRLIPGQEYRGLSLAPFTSWWIGGCAARAYVPKNIEDLQQYLSRLPKEMPILWLGLGSNVLISDDGFDGAVILTTALSHIEMAADGSIHAAAGVTCARLARFCIHAQREGSFFAGIPGSVGGALAMNAGAYGGETWTQVRTVDYLTKEGQYLVLPKADFKISYRTAIAPMPGWFLGATFDLPRDSRSSTELHQAMRALLQQRQASQPIGLRSCGSVFRNPEGDHAARLIEACGLKGFGYGDAQISDKHANFIINVGNATAKQTYDLIRHIQTVVMDRYQIALVPEVHFIGEF